MRLHNYLKERKIKTTGKKLEGTMIGYKIGLSSIRGIHDYIKSWLDKYNIDYKENTNPHITVAQIVGRYSKPRIIRTMRQMPSNFEMRPKQLKMMYGQNVGKYFITIEMERDKNYIQAHNIVREEMPEIRTFPGGMKPHISLFILEENKKDQHVWKEIRQSNPNLPIIKIKEIELFNRKFLPEFILKR